MCMKSVVIPKIGFKHVKGKNIVDVIIDGHFMGYLKPISVTGEQYWVASQCVNFKLLGYDFKNPISGRDLDIIKATIRKIWKEKHQILKPELKGWSI